MKKTIMLAALLLFCSCERAPMSSAGLIGCEPIIGMSGCKICSVDAHYKGGSGRNTLQVFCEAEKPTRVESTSGVENYSKLKCEKIGTPVIDVVSKTLVYTSKCDISALIDTMGL